MCPSGATYLSEDCCFCELAFKNWTQRVGLKQSGSNNHLIIYCLKSSQVTPITFSDLLLIYMFLVLFGILVYISPFFLPMFLSCLSLTNKFVFHIWCRVKTWIVCSYMVTISSIGWGKRKIRRIPPTCRKPLANCIT